jgi:hypothetical protein
LKECRTVEGVDNMLRTLSLRKFWNVMAGSGEHRTRADFLICWPLPTMFFGNRSRKKYEGIGKEVAVDVAKDIKMDM